MTFFVRKSRSHHTLSKYKNKVKIQYRHISVEYTHTSGITVAPNDSVR